MRDVHSAPGLAITVDAPREGSPTALLAQVELHFLEGPLVGLSLRGFSVWSGTGRTLVTPPRLGSSMEFLRRSPLARPELAERAWRALFEAIREAHSEH